MGLQDVSPHSVQFPPGEPEFFDIRMSVSVRDAGLLWRMAAAHALAMTGLEQQDVEDVIGPMDDPSLGDCLAMLLAPRNLAGCSFRDFSVLRAVAPAPVAKPRRVRKTRPALPHPTKEGGAISPLFPALAPDRLPRVSR